MARGEHEFAKRKIYFVLALFFLLVAASYMLAGLRLHIYYFDEVGALIFSLVTVVYLAFFWRRNSTVDLIKQNNAVFILFVGMVISMLLGVILEGGNVDWKTEIPILIGMIMALGNRFF